MCQISILLNPNEAAMPNACQMCGFRWAAIVCRLLMGSTNNRFLPNGIRLHRRNCRKRSYRGGPRQAARPMQGTAAGRGTLHAAFVLVPVLAMHLQDTIGNTIESMQICLRSKLKQSFWSDVTVECDCSMMIWGIRTSLRHQPSYHLGGVARLSDLRPPQLYAHLIPHIISKDCLTV